MEFLIFVAPPAYGKTQWLKSYAREQSKGVILCPLRAIAEELIKQAWPQPVYSLWEKDGDHWQKFLQVSQGWLITTPESIFGKLKHPPSAGDFNFVVVWDEWHLFEIWGESFRPLLRELQFLLWDLVPFHIGLTATLDDQLLVELEVLSQYLSIQVVSFGNFKIRNPPEVRVYYPAEFSHWFELRLKICLIQQQRILLFVPWRDQVDEWENKLSKYAKGILTCKGGETSQFVRALEKMTDCRCIIATTVLSHGVNIPSVDAIFFENMKLDNTFWLQMITRGGRKGERFKLYAYKEKSSLYTFEERWAKLFFWAINDLWKLKVWCCKQWIIKSVTWWLSFWDAMVKSTASLFMVGKGEAKIKNLSSIN